MRIQATNLKTSERIFGALNIGKLKETPIVTFRNKPVFENEKGELVFCSPLMFRNINARLKINKII